MKSKFASFIITLVMLLIIIILGIFGVIVWQEIQDMTTTAQPENFQTIYTGEGEETTKNIQTPEIIENPFDDIEGSNSNPQTQEVNYDSVNIDKYFYNLLEDYSKTIYKAFESNKENMKTGNYKIELGSSFSSLLATENGQNELGKYYQSAIEAYTYDNPKIFYLNPNKMYLNIETTTRGTNKTYYVYINSGNEANYFIDEFTSKAQVDSAISAIEQVKNNILQNRSQNTYENIKMVHDYLVDNIEYETTISKANIYNVYGALINGEAVCEGYARAFKYLMDELEIPCTLVIGKGTNSQGQTENHAWNYVMLNGNWYAVDCTWDDPVTYGGVASQSSRYKYFLKGSNTMNVDHIPSGQFTEGGKMFNYPSLSSRDIS